MSNMKNLSSGTLYNGVSASATTLAVFCGNGSETEVKAVWPTAPFLITVMPGVPVAGVPNSMDSEIMKVTAVGTDNLGNVLLTVVRAQENTTAKAFEAGAVVTNGVYTSDMELPVASTSSRGIVQLTDSITSSSTELAATASAVMKANGLRGGYNGNVSDKWCHFMRITISKIYKEYIARFTFAPTQTKRWGCDCYIRVCNATNGVLVDSEEMVFTAKNIGDSLTNYDLVGNLVAVKTSSSTVDLYWKTHGSSSAMSHLYSSVSMYPDDPTYGSYEVFTNDLVDTLPEGDTVYATKGLPGEEVLIHTYKPSGSAGTLSIPVDFIRYSGYIIRGAMEPVSGTTQQELNVVALNKSNNTINTILHDMKFVTGQFSTTYNGSANTILQVPFYNSSQTVFDIEILSANETNYVAGFGKSFMNDYSHNTSFRISETGRGISKINIPYPALKNSGRVNVYGVVRG